MTSLNITTSKLLEGYWKLGNNGGREWVAGSSDPDYDAEDPDASKPNAGSSVERLTNALVNDIAFHKALFNGENSPSLANQRIVWNFVNTHANRLKLNMSDAEKTEALETAVSELDSDYDHNYSSAADRDAEFKYKDAESTVNDSIYSLLEVAKHERPDAPYCVVTDYDGVPDTAEECLVAGEREDCVRWITQNWGKYKGKYSLALMNLETNRLESFTFTEGAMGLSVGGVGSKISPPEVPDLLPEANKIVVGTKIEFPPKSGFPTGAKRGESVIGTVIEIESANSFMPDAVYWVKVPTCTDPMEVSDYDINNNIVKVLPTTEESVSQSTSPAWYLVNATGSNVTTNTSSSSFASEEDAKKYKTKYNHVPAVRNSKIVQGTSDQYGFVTPATTEELGQPTSPGGEEMLKGASESSSTLDKLIYTVLSEMTIDQRLTNLKLRRDKWETQIKSQFPDVVISPCYGDTSGSLVAKVYDQDTHMYKVVGSFDSKKESTQSTKTKLTEAKDVMKGRVVQYHTNEDNTVFKPTGKNKIVQILDPGIYKIESSFESGLTFSKMSINSDELLRFEDARYTQSLNEIAKFWTLEEKYAKVGFTHKRGMLLYGAPGTGKSCLLKLVMESQVNNGDLVLIMDSYAPIVSAIESIRSIEPDRRILVVLEDMDEIVRSQEHEILELFDGPNQLGKVLYLGTTNYIEQLPPRILRPGRFDTKLEIGNPPSGGRREYFRKKIKGLNETQLEELVAATDDFSFAELREFAVCRFCYDMELQDAVAKIKDPNYGKHLREEPYTAKKSLAIAKRKVSESKKLTESKSRKIKLLEGLHTDIYLQPVGMLVTITQNPDNTTGVVVLPINGISHQTDVPDEMDDPNDILDFSKAKVPEVPMERDRNDTPRYEASKGSIVSTQGNGSWQFWDETGLIATIRFKSTDIAQDIVNGRKLFGVTEEGRMYNLSWNKISDNIELELDVGKMYFYVCSGEQLNQLTSGKTLTTGVSRNPHMTEDSDPIIAPDTVAVESDAPKVIDMSNVPEEFLYDMTQTEDKINEGDVLYLGPNCVALMDQAWPTMVVGTPKGGFHELSDGYTWDEIEGGKYKASATLAKEVAKNPKSIPMTKMLGESIDTLVLEYCLTPELDRTFRVVRKSDGRSVYFSSFNGCVAFIRSFDDTSDEYVDMDIHTAQGEEVDWHGILGESVTDKLLGYSMYTDYATWSKEVKAKGAISVPHSVDFDIGAYGSDNVSCYGIWYGFDDKYGVVFDKPAKAVDSTSGKFIDLPPGFDDNGTLLDYDTAVESLHLASNATVTRPLDAAKNEFTDFEDWQAAINQSYGAKVRYIGSGNTIAANEIGKDRCLGIWDLVTDTGQLLGGDEVPKEDANFNTPNYNTPYTAKNEGRDWDTISRESITTYMLREDATAKIKLIASKQGEKITASFNKDKSVLPPESTPEQVLSELVKADPTSNAAYLQWIVNRYIDGQFKLEDTTRLKGDIEKFVKYKAKIDNKDLNSYPSLTALYDVIEKFSTEDDTKPVVSKNAADKNIKNNEVKYVINTPNFKVLIPLTHAASCIYGKGTKWCTASTSDPAAFDQYSGKGELYIIIAKDQSGVDKKYQFNVPTQSYMDARDQAISKSDIDFLSKFPEYKQFLDMLIKKYYFD